MITPMKAYSYYHGLHLHFGADSYSILKYGANTKQAADKFKKLTPNQKFRFDWLANKFSKTEDLVFAIIGCELNDIDARFGNKQEILDSYYEIKSRRDSITNVLRNEYTKYVERNEFKFHQLIFNYLAKQYSPEFLLLLDHETNHLSTILDSTNFSFVRTKILKLVKYKSFFSPTKYLSILNHEEPVSA